MTAKAVLNDVTIQGYELWTGTHGDERIRITNSSINNPENCQDPDSYMVDLTLSEEHKARIYSTLLATVMTDRPVRVVIDGCQSARPRIINVIIK